MCNPTKNFIQLQGHVPDLMNPQDNIEISFVYVQYIQLIILLAYIVSSAYDN